MEKKIVIDLILIGSIVIFIGVIIYSITIFKADGMSCLSNPIGYIEHLNNISCQCQEYKPYLDIDELNFSEVRIRP